MREVRYLRLFALVAALVLVFAACGGDDDDGGGGGGDGEVTIIHGTTDPWVSFDPSGSYDLPSWNVIYNVFEGLMTIPPGGGVPEPAAAESCEFTDPQTYQCTLGEGVTFHDGSTLDSGDVAASFERNIRIASPNGACSLLASLAACEEWTGDEIETPDDRTVIFHLNTADATWPYVLTTGAAGIVPSEYPARDIQADNQAAGTGPYQVADYRPGEQLVLEAYDDYHGDAPAADRVIVQLFDKSSALKLAIEQGEVDIAYRNLTPTEIEDLRGTGDLEVVEGQGTEIRYLVFNTKLEPGDDLAVRRAVAMTVDRQAIVDNVYAGTVDPLYSMVPVGLEGHIDAFAEEYGESPDPDQAAQVLEQAGVQTPVDIEIWWTPSHYGDLSADEYTEIKRALEGSELFEVSLKSTEWDGYSTAAFEDQYPAYQLGWFPDFTDPDNYLAPFYGSETGFLNNGYKNAAIDRAIETERTSTDEAERVAAFETIQRIAAQEAPLIPIWQGGQIAVTQPGISGVEDTFDASFQFRYWLLSKE